MTTSADGHGNSRRDEITKIAAVLFDRIGFHETSMDDLAAEVGIKKPTLYHYVDSKAQIVYWIHDDLQRELRDRLRARLDTGMEPPEILFEVMADIFEMMEEYPGHLKVFFEHHRNLPEDMRSQATRQRDEYFLSVENVIRDGIERGQLQAGNTRLTTLGLFGMCNWSYQWFRPGGPLQSRDVARYLWNLFMQGAGGSGWDGPGDQAAAQMRQVEDSRTRTATP